MNVTPLSGFYEIKCVPPEQVENKMFMTRDDLEVAVPLKAGVKQNESGCVVSRARTKGGKNNKQCFP